MLIQILMQGTPNYNTIIFTVVITAILGSVVAGVKWAFKVYGEFRASQEKMAILWERAKRDSTEELHHSDQPVFDKLLDDYKDGSLTKEGRDQLIDRVKVIASGEAQKPDQVLAAKVLLLDAQQEQVDHEAKIGNTVVPGSLSEGAQKAVNKDAKTAMATEGAASSEPERGPDTSSPKEPLQSEPDAPVPVADAAVLAKLDSVVITKLDAIQETVKKEKSDV